ncbi:hypothetical protein O4220_11505 [Rhodococcus ruber]|uniref:Uncharacterized protein n=1 Tax=Rhodococcus ruber TaxID=1830 RepID=A0ABT4MDV1_9NOCA|nr:hypothetical protein [Rhodococcus ruber]MCZ4519141.1 hypothetical protein [Rhodococcus ruber]
MTYADSVYFNGRVFTVDAGFRVVSAVAVLADVIGHAAVVVGRGVPDGEFDRGCGCNGARGGGRVDRG